MQIKVRPFTGADVAAMNRIWNHVVEDGMAFPQLDTLDEVSGAAFYAAQSYCAVAEDTERIQFRAKKPKGEINNER